MTTSTVRVLVVESGNDLQGKLQQIIPVAPNIELAGATASGKRAVALALELKPHVALVAMNLEDMNGIEALKALRAQAPTLEVLLVSDPAGPGPLVFEAMEAGARDFLVPPFRLQELTTAIQQAYALRKK